MITLAELLEVAKRWLCRRIGHNWREDGGHASPVIPLIFVCRRCGRFERARLNFSVRENR